METISSSSPDHRSLRREFGVFDAVILGLSRVLLAMGRRGDMPAAVARVSGRYATPAVAVCVVGTLIAGLAAYVFLAFWIEWRIWGTGLALIGVGLMWHGMARRFRLDAASRLR